MELLRWPESAGLKERNTHEKDGKPTEVKNHHKELRPKRKIGLTAAIGPSGVKQHMAVRNDARPHRVARNVPDVNKFPVIGCVSEQQQNYEQAKATRWNPKGFPKVRGGDFFPIEHFAMINFLTARTGPSRIFSWEVMDMIVSLKKRQDAGITLLEIAEIYKQYRPERTKTRHSRQS